MGNHTSHPDDFKHEEPTTDYQWLQEDKWLNVDRPRRIMKNPTVPPCKRGECADPVQYLEFKEWMAKEWAVHCAQIKYMQVQVDQCFQKHGIDAKRHCGDLVREYMNTVSDEALMEARRYDFPV